MPETYAKPFLTINEQIELLGQRGLGVANVAVAAATLSEYGYYRVSGYSYPMRKYDLAQMSHIDQFVPGSNIEHVADLIEFDRKLRSIFICAAERVEIAVRVQVAMLLGARDPWAHRDKGQFHENFVNRIDKNSNKIPYDDWIYRLDELESSSKEDFASHFREKYNNPPPIWVSIELWSFGLLSRLIGGMVAADQKHLGGIYGFTRRETFPSLIRSINHVRNIAAHHSRIWNRSPADQPSPPRLGEIASLDHLAGDQFAQVRLYGVAALTQFILKQINKPAADDWANQLKAHFATFPTIPGVPVTQTGFPIGWEQETLWN